MNLNGVKPVGPSIPFVFPYLMNFGDILVVVFVFFHTRLLCLFFWKEIPEIEGSPFEEI